MDQVRGGAQGHPVRVWSKLFSFPQTGFREETGTPRKISPHDHIAPAPGSSTPGPKVVIHILLVQSWSRHVGQNHIANFWFVLRVSPESLSRSSLRTCGAPGPPIPLMCKCCKFMVSHIFLGKCYGSAVKLPSIAQVPNAPRYL